MYNMMGRDVSLNMMQRQRMNDMSANRNMYNMMDQDRYNNMMGRDMSSNMMNRNMMGQDMHSLMNNKVMGKNIYSNMMGRDMSSNMMGRRMNAYGNDVNSLPLGQRNTMSQRMEIEQIPQNVASNRFF